MNIEPWEIESFIKRFSECPQYEAIMWLEDRGCYEAIEDTFCELMASLAREWPAHWDKNVESSQLFWQWAKSAALEELEKLNRESKDEDV